MHSVVQILMTTLLFSSLVTEGAGVVCAAGAKQEFKAEITPYTILGLSKSASDAEILGVTKEQLNDPKVFKLIDETYRRHLDKTEQLKVSQAHSASEWNQDYETVVELISTKDRKKIAEASWIVVGKKLKGNVAGPRGTLLYLAQMIEEKLPADVRESYDWKILMSMLRYGMHC